MSSPDTDKVFSGSIPKLYETHLVPLIFEPYAADLANRLASRSLARVLEIAAGTGVVTRRLASVLPESVSIVATDLNQAMLDRLRRSEPGAPWSGVRQTPCNCPSRTQCLTPSCASSESCFSRQAESVFGGAPGAQVGRRFRVQRVGPNRGKRICRHGDDGTRILFPEDPPRFLARTPHGYHDLATIERDLKQGGFTASPQIRRLRRAAGSISADPRDRILPRDATTKRDRGAGRLAARRSNRHRGGSHRPAFRAGSGGRQDPGAHRHRRTLKASNEGAAL